MNHELREKENKMYILSRTMKNALQKLSKDLEKFNKRPSNEGNLKKLKF